MYILHDLHQFPREYFDCFSRSTSSNFQRKAEDECEDLNNRDETHAVNNLFLLSSAILVLSAVHKLFSNTIDLSSLTFKTCSLEMKLALLPVKVLLQKKPKFTCKGRRKSSKSEHCVTAVAHPHVVGVTSFSVSFHVAYAFILSFSSQKKQLGPNQFRIIVPKWRMHLAPKEKSMTPRVR